MKNAFNSILLLTVVGFIVLSAGAFYFGAPLFGWIIMIAIFAVFVVEQLVALGKVRKVKVEDDLIVQCEKSGSFEVDGDGVVASRLKLARRLMEKGIRLDSPIAFEVLTGSSNITLPRSSSGTVILLGLMGTFFGLMSSVATAGSAIDNSTTQGTLDTIQVLFQNMKGIFGTSLCGLFAALILNATRGIMMAKRDAFMAHLDGLTLDMQGGASDAVEQDKSEIEKLFGIVSKNLNDVVGSVQQGLSGIVDRVGNELSATTNKLSSEISGMAKSMGESVSGAFAPMENSVKALSTSVEAIPSKIEDKLGALSGSLERGLGNISDGVKAGLEGVALDVKSALSGVSGSVYEGLNKVSESAQNSMADSSNSIAASIAEQVKQSNEQWNSFMQRLEEKTNSNVDAEKEGLETLKNVALQVAEKAQAGSAELSQSVSEKLSTLSTDILGAFQKLSETSATLLEAQKALTESIDNRVVKEKEATDALGGNIVETAELMRVNQSELSANLEMLRSALESILEKLSGDTAEHEEEDNFVEHLNQSLEAFHERASEVLMENAVKTQEILLEVMEQTQRASLASGAPKVEG